MNKEVFKSKSFWAIVFCSAFLLFTRFRNVTDYEITFDVLGYYMYLPATFVHDDPLLTDVSWLKKEIEENKRSGTMYMVTTTKKGEPMYFFMMGMALIFLPWFLIGHAAAYLFDFPPDGFSEPYVYSLILGGVFYTICGLLILRKLLKEFFSENLSAILILILFLGTNVVHHLIAKNLETVNVLFMLCVLVFYQTVKWHQNQKSYRLYIIAAGIALMALVKPSEVLIGLLPVFYGIYNKETLTAKLDLLKSNWKCLSIAMCVGLAVLSPQMFYWFSKTGKIIVDSYYNPGVGLDWWNPHTLQVLFSYKKGWLLYTPVMVFGLIGFYFWYKKDRQSLCGPLVYFLVAFFILSCWTEWWYGSSYSCRPVITYYPVLCVAIGFFIQNIWEKRRKLIWVLTPLIVFFVFLNQFQWWQFKNYILDDYSMTKEYYWKTFLSSTVTAKDKELLSFKRDFILGNYLEDKENYKSYDFSKLSIKSLQTISDNLEWGLAVKTPIEEMTQKDHFYIEWEIKYKYPERLPKNGFPCLVTCVERKDGVYGYSAPELKADSTDKIMTFKHLYLSPPIRETSDLLNTHVWNRGGTELEIISRKATVWEPKK